MAVNMTATLVSLNNWIAGLDGKIRGSDSSGLLGGSFLTYDLSIPVDAIWVEDGYVGTESGTEAEPYSTLRLALNQTTNGVGAHIVIKDATIAVTQTNRVDWCVNDRGTSGFSPVNSGASWATSHLDRSNMITIRAETVHGVRFSFTGSSQDYYQLFNAESAQYLSYDGFILDYDATSGAAVINCITTGDNNYISRCIVKREGSSQYGSWVHCNDFSLVEMCAGVGGTRYGFRSGASQTTATTNSCFRACVARQDFGQYTEPSASFAHYGNDTGNLSLDTAFLNCIALDGRWDTTTINDDYRYGSLYLPKNATDIAIKGFISLNEQLEFAAIFAGENDALGCTVEDSVIWDTTGGAGAATDGYRCFVTGLGTGNAATGLTIGNVDDDFEYHNNTTNATSSRFNDLLNGTNPSIMHQTDGADARFLFGSLGQRFGDTGFDVKSATPLLPFPYEAQIKTVFTEQINTPAGEYPPSNTSARGFCLTTSLSDYLVKYVNGSTTVEEIY